MNVCVGVGVIKSQNICMGNKSNTIILYCEVVYQRELFYYNIW